VTDLGPESMITVFLIFCRVGGCLLVVPGFSASHVPVRVRLFIAIGVTFAFTPLLGPLVAPVARDLSTAALLQSIASETFTGLAIGLMGRLFFAALQTFALVVVQAIGLGGMPGTVIEDAEPLPSIVTLFTLTAVTLMFISNQHWELLRGIVESYRVVPPGEGLTPRLDLAQIANQLSVTFLLGLRIASPFVIYSVVVNFAVGLANKLTPQIPVYFIAMPFVTAGGLLLLFIAFRAFMESFLDGFGQWLVQG